LLETFIAAVDSECNADSRVWWQVATNDLPPDLPHSAEIFSCILYSDIWTIVASAVTRTVYLIAVSVNVGHSLTELSEWWFEQSLMVNNYEHNIEILTKKLKNVAGLLEQRVQSLFIFLFFYYIWCR